MTAAIEAFEERAAILEHDARMSRNQAESLALREVAAEFGQLAARVVYRRMMDARQERAA